jgi:hypothetical protein
MDLFLAISQGVGLALACGIAVASLVALPLNNGRLMPVIALLTGVAGALVFAWSLADDDYASVPGLIPGGLCAALGLTASSTFLSGVRKRLEARQVSPVGLTFFAGLAAICLAAIAFVVPPLSYLALAFCAWILLERRKRAGEKYEGLRVLR